MLSITLIIGRTFVGKNQLGTQHLIADVVFARGSMGNCGPILAQHRAYFKLVLNTGEIFL